jgi:hypothetical protein
MSWRLWASSEFGAATRQQFTAVGALARSA